jgi:hypothetical protein
MLVMTATEEAARRVAEAIRTRRAELGLSQQEVVARVREGGQTVSLNNFRAYEWGSRPNPSVAVLAAISVADDRFRAAIT